MKPRLVKSIRFARFSIKEGVSWYRRHGRLPRGSEFYDLLRKIPAGKVTTYGALAKALGNPSASRIIGRILGQNPNPIKVPCHRVVMSDGKLGGYAYGTVKKRGLLEKEGLSFTNGIVSDFTKVRISLSSNGKTRD